MKNRDKYSKIELVNKETARGCFPHVTDFGPRARLEEGLNRIAAIILLENDK